MSAPKQAPSSQPPDPVLVHARREVAAIVVAFVICAIWSVSWCYFHGYYVEDKPLRTVMGLPSWVFWGIAVPWVICDVFTIWLCFAYMEDDPLGEEIDTAAAQTGEADAGGTSNRPGEERDD